MSTPADFNAKVIEEFHANEGRVGGPFEGMPLLLLHHTGAKSGQARINPLAYQADGGRYVIFASKAGAPSNPDWYHNLKAHPNVTIEVGSETIDVVASEASGEERDRLYATQAERVPQFAEYEKTAAGRLIPVIVLTPRRAPEHGSGRSFESRRGGRPGGELSSCGSGSIAPGVWVLTRTESSFSRWLSSARPTRPTSRPPIDFRSSAGLGEFRLGDAPPRRG